MSLPHQGAETPDGYNPPERNDLANDGSPTRGVRRRGRPPKGVVQAPPGGLSSRIVKVYEFSDGVEATVGCLQGILAQRDIPSSALVRLRKDSLSVEWTQ